MSGKLTLFFTADPQVRCTNLLYRKGNGPDQCHNFGGSPVHRTAINKKKPTNLGEDNTITRYIHPDHPGGRGIELAYTPNWSLAYKASLKVSPHWGDDANNAQASLPDGTETAPLHDYTSLECSQFVGPERDHMAIGHWPVHTADDDQSGLLKALHQVSCVAKNHADLDNFLDDIDVELPRNGDAISFSKIIPCTRTVVTLNPFSVERSDTEVKLTLEASLAVWIRGEQDDRDLLPATQHKD